MIGDWQVTFEVAFDTDPGTEPGVWTDLSSRVRSPVRAGQARAGNGRPATLTLNNRDRALDPTNTAATYNLVPWRHARLKVVHNAVTYSLFRGFVDDWPPVWPEYNAGLINVRLVDGFAWVALTELDVDLPEQTTGARINALLDLAGWPAGLRDIDTGIVTVEAYEQDAVSVLRVLIDTVDSEDGYLYAAPDGKITFRDRHHTFDATPTITFGTGGLRIAGVNPRFGGKGIVNIGRAELADGDVYEVVDDASYDAYGPHTWTARDLPLSPAEAEGLPQWYVVRYAEPLLRVDGLEVGGQDTGALPELLEARIGDVADFSHTPTGGGVAEMTGVVESIDYVFEKGEAKATFELDSYHGDGPWFTLDHDTLGLPNGLNQLAP